MATLKEKLQQSFIEDNPALGVLRGVKESFVGEDAPEATNLKGLSSEERIARLRGSIDQNLPTSGALFGEEIGNVIADFPQGTARVLDFGGRKAMETIGLQPMQGSESANQFLFGDTGSTARSLPELGEQEFGVDAEAMPFLAGVAGFGALALETPVGKAFKKGGQSVKQLVSDNDFESIYSKVSNMFPNLQESELRTLSDVTSKTDNPELIAKSLNSANFNNILKGAENAAIRRGANSAITQGNVANAITKGGNADANGYVDVFISGSPEQIKKLKTTGDPTGLLASVKRSKSTNPNVAVTKVKIPGEDIQFKLGSNVSLADGAIGRSLSPTDAKITNTLSKITDDVAKIDIEEVQDVIKSLNVVGSKASQNKLATIGKVRNSLDSIARNYSTNYQGIEKSIQQATNARQFKDILKDIVDGVATGKITPSVKVKNIVAKANKAPAGGVKSAIRRETGQIKDNELQLLNEQIQKKANRALAQKSAKDLAKAKEILDAANDDVKIKARNAKAEVADIEEGKKLADLYIRDGKLFGFGKRVERGETVGEYAIGKSAKALRGIQKPSETAVDKLSKLKLDSDKGAAIFDYRESKNPDFLSDFSKEEIEQIKSLDQAITETTNIIGDFLVDLNLLDEKGDASTYMQTFLRNADGTPASDAKIAQLRLDMGDNFTELMSSFSQSLNKTKLNKNRKYATAIERDAVLEKYGLKTDKDIERVFSNYVANTSKLIEKEVVSQSIRQVAKSGTRADLLEIFDPVKLKSQRAALTDSVKELRLSLLKDLSAFKEISKKQVSDLKASKKDFDLSIRGLGEDVDVLDLQGIDAKQLDSMFDDILEVAVDAPKKVRQAIDYKINLARSNAKKELRGIYGDIAKKYGEASDSGLKWLSGSSAPSLRGVMGNARDTKMVDEIFRFRDADTISGNIDQISQSIKLATATGDLFSVPRAYWMAAQATNPIKAAQIWKKSMTPGSVSEDLINDASEFILVSRNTVGDAETLKRISSDLEKDMTTFDKMMKNLDEATDVQGLSEAKDKIANGFRALEKWQFEVFMTQAKAQTWEVAYKQLVKKGIPEREAKVEAGRMIDKLSGVTDLNKLMARNPKMLSKDVQKGMRILLFAPNLLLTTMRTLGVYSTNLFAPGAKGMLARKVAMNTVMTSMAVLQSLSYAINGHSSFENEDKNKVLALKLPFKDEKGNTFYLNPLGWIARPFELINKPVENMSNKVGGLSRFAVNLLSGRPFENSAESRIGEAVSGIIPLPFTFQGVMDYASAQFKDDPQYGVAENFLDQMTITALEFVGFEGVFTGGGSRTTSLVNMYKEVDEAINNNDDFAHVFSPEMIEAYALSKEMPSKRDIYKSRYKISGRTTDDSFIKKVREMDTASRQDFISGYAESTQKQIREDLGNLGGGEVSFDDVSSDEIDFSVTSSDDIDFSSTDDEEIDFSFSSDDNITF